MAFSENQGNYSLGTFKINGLKEGGVPKELWQALIGVEDVSEINPDEAEGLFTMLEMKLQKVE